MPAKKKTSKSRFIDAIQHRNRLIEFHCTVHGADETEYTSNPEAHWDTTGRLSVRFPRVERNRQGLNFYLYMRRPQVEHLIKVLKHALDTYPLGAEQYEPDGGIPL